MTITKHCLGSNQAIITYQTGTPEGLLVTYPDDGANDRYKEGGQWTSQTIYKAVNYESFDDIEHSPFLIKGSVPSWVDGLINETSYTTFCGDTFYWHHLYNAKLFPELTAINDAIKNGTLTSWNGWNFILQRFPNSNDRRTNSSYVAFYNQEINDDGTVPTGFKAIFPRNLFVFSNGCKNWSDINYANIDTSSFVIDKVIRLANLIGYDFFDRDGLKINHISRSVHPISIEYQEPRLDPPQQLTYDFEQDVEQLYIDEIGQYVYVYAENVNTSSRRYLGFFNNTISDTPPAWSVECVEVLDECPENTCEVDCHTHTCCYGSDGIAVHSFSKP